MPHCTVFISDALTHVHVQTQFGSCLHWTVFISDALTHVHVQTHTHIHTHTHTGSRAAFGGTQLGVELEEGKRQDLQV